jgi:hypothetical protein
MPQGSRILCPSLGFTNNPKGNTMEKEITVTLTPLEVMVLAVAIATVPAGPPAIEDAINEIARKILDAQDLAMIPTI